MEMNSHLLYRRIELSNLNKPEIAARKFLSGIFSDNPSSPDEVLDELDYYDNDEKFAFIMNLCPLLAVLRVMIFTSKGEESLQKFCHFCKYFKSFHQNCGCSHDECEVDGDGAQT